MRISPAEFAKLMPSLSQLERNELDTMLAEGTVPWVAQIGPQKQALESKADILFYGGSAGGGKTDLVLGLALTEHHRSIIFRREAVQLVGIEERLTEILGSRTGYDSQDGIWRVPGGRRVVELGSVKEPEDWQKYQGRPHDLKAFDEIPLFLERQFRALIGWMRSDRPSQRLRVVCTGNPPTSAEGEWVIRFWAPWLDPMHPNPAKPGELRWYVTDAEGKDMEVPGPDPVQIGNEVMMPMSRTFIPSRVEDNLFLTLTNYKATLQALPEPLRSQMLRGDFQAGRADPVWQLIPTEWIKAAQARWVKREFKGKMSALGFDVARGGDDKSSIARRHGQWFDEVLTQPGFVTKDGPSAAGWVVQHLRNGAPVCVDSIGIGASALDFLQGMRVLCVPVVGSEKSDLSDKTGNLRFRNKRAEMYWLMREALDPTAEEPISIPPDSELLGDLSAVRYKIVTAGRYAAILVRDKDEIRELLGRSPDKGDAVAMTFISEAASAVAHPEQDREDPDWQTA